MSRIFYNKFDKKQLQFLPQASFMGRIIVVSTNEMAEKAVDFLLTHTILGIDTETRPVFKKGQSYQVALLQVATHDMCFLFRLNLIGFTNAIKRLLENTKIPMIGLSLQDDMNALRKRGSFEMGYFIDLQNIVGDIGIEDMSLQKIYANLFQEKISKRQQLSNWEQTELTDKQKQYAATDAWACIRIYEEIIRMKKAGDYTLVTIEEPKTELQDEIKL